ncbi:hypothetical protein [Streptomyces sp. NBC_00687]|uniref:hypothetical protein n=1 Tax=Streptomyces sp. NBC_00687 TaxID=2975807 RepID=UPI00224FF76C|nr:hypothetical protein [Streptomyces sp. NBC_00687]MCX4912012.1 hypothetical protein [Streptomyces sp. NBC_00687]
MACDNLKIPDWTYDGGFAETMIVPADVLVRIPDVLSAADAGTLVWRGSNDADLVVQCAQYQLVTMFRVGPPTRRRSRWC